MSRPQCWTPEEDAALLAAYSDPSPDAVRKIAQRLGRGYAATRVRANKIGARRRDVRGKKVKTGFDATHRAPTTSTDSTDPIHAAYRAWRRPVIEA